MYDLHASDDNDEENIYNDDGVIYVDCSSSMWQNIVTKVKSHTEDHGSVDFVE